MALTKIQVKRLNAAIDAAVGPAGCVYIQDNAPYCVIGQLAVIDGISLKTLRRWGENKITAVSGSAARKLCTSYGAHLLSQLQSLWDTAYGPEAKVRAVMHSLVRRAAK